METRDQAAVARLIRRERWASLATLREGAPFASLVAYAPEPDLAGFLLHLSRLAPHTQNLLNDPRATLAICEPDTGSGDPHTLARLSLEGVVEVVPPETADYDAARDIYLQRLPETEKLFGFGDFVLFRLVPREARYVGGFARAFSLSAAELRAAAAR
jgi:putative heme iron utilization protein